MMFGLLNLNKPVGISSRKAIDRVQRLVRPAKTGHAGTLDPIAQGVLVVTIGSATRLTERVHLWPKTYRGTFLLGHTSVTEDIEGDVEVLEGVPAPTRQQLESCLPDLTGDIQQQPPAYSALKVNGHRAYKLAREGQEVKLAARTITIHELQIESYNYPELVLRIVCSSGTYVRSLGRDLARAAGTEAVMSALTRTAVGHLRIEDAIDWQTLDDANLEAAILPAVEAVPDLPRWQVTDAQMPLLSTGAMLECIGETADELAAITPDGQLGAIMTRKLPEQYRPVRNFVASRS